MSTTKTLVGSIQPARNELRPGDQGGPPGSTTTCARLTCQPSAARSGASVDTRCLRSRRPRRELHEQLNEQLVGLRFRDAVPTGPALAAAVSLQRLGGAAAVTLALMQRDLNPVVLVDKVEQRELVARRHRAVLDELYQEIGGAFLVWRGTEPDKYASTRGDEAYMDESSMEKGRGGGGGEEERERERESMMQSGAR